MNAIIDEDLPRSFASVLTKIEFDAFSNLRKFGANLKYRPGAFTLKSFYDPLNAKILIKKSFLGFSRIRGRR